MLYTIKTKIAGVTFENSDGSSRQEYLKSVQSGDSLVFRDTSSPQYPESIGVFTQSGAQLGNLPAEISRTIRASGASIVAIKGTVYSVGRSNDASPLGCQIDVTYNGRSTSSEMPRVIPTVMPDGIQPAEPPVVKKRSMWPVILTIVVIVGLALFGMSKVIDFITSPLK